MESNNSTSTSTLFSKQLVGVISPSHQTLSISSEGGITVQVTNPIIRLFAEIVVR
jgi:hypothetical protein